MIVLINPNLVVSEKDIFTTGIVYMPVALCSLAASFRQQQIPVTLIDSFGLSPNQIRQDGPFLLRGISPSETVGLIPSSTEMVFLYAISLSSHRSVVAILKQIKKSLPHVQVVILENTQAVTAYSIRHVQEEFYAEGADFILSGEAEERAIKFYRKWKQGENAEQLSEIDGLGLRHEGRTIYRAPEKKFLNLDQLPFPAYELLPLKNYWHLRYAHGPFETDKYLPLLTSRGCPYPCKFCVIPETNSLKWRGRSAQNIVDEMEYFYRLLGVREFHIEDVNPTVDHGRTIKFCQELIQRKLPVIWKICAGTKVETIRDEQTIELMAQAGCKYISISPETGSPRVLKLINKPFKLEHAVGLVKKMNQVGIRSQACFVLGHPGEEDSDRLLTKNLIKGLTKVGVDEIALFIITPVPGSSIFPLYNGYTDYSQLNFSPSWRQDYVQLNRFRISLYRHFLWWKFLYWPSKMLIQPLKFLSRKFATKMEMTPYRALHTFFISFFRKRAPIEWSS